MTENGDWSENRKFVLDSLDRLQSDVGDVSDKLDEKFDELEEDLREGRKGLREDLRGDFRSRIDDIQADLEEQDATDRVQELETKQKIIGVGVLLVFATMMYIHFGIALPFL